MSNRLVDLSVRLFHGVFIHQVSDKVHPELGGNAVTITKWSMAGSTVDAKSFLTSVEQVGIDWKWVD